MFFLRNLASTEVHKGEPWNPAPHDPVPPQAIADKAFRTRWMTDPKTNYPAYSLVEGLNAGLRLKGPSATDEDGNPPHALHGIVADYDLKLGQAEIDAGLARMNFKPTWLETSLSGNLRAIWIFERPVLLHSYAYALHLLKHVCDFLPLKTMPGLDMPALLSPDRYYTTGLSWVKTPAGPVPDALVQNFLVEISSKFEWVSEGPVVPLEVIAAECAKKFPRFKTWPGPFTLGASGPSFWIDGSVSQKSAIVRETGISTFAAHATKPFYNWSEIVGAEIVQQFKARQMGEAVKDIFFDEKNYFSRLSCGTWAIDNLTSISLLLKAGRGLSDRTRKGEHCSEVEQAMLYIQRNQRVRTAASFAFYPEGVGVWNGERILNTHCVKALSPAPGVATWGQDGQFPWISKFLDTLFFPADQLPFFLSWTKFFYQSCLTRVPRAGTCLFICGGVSTGKTFLSRCLLAGLVGGFAECNDYFMGSDNFNAEIFDKALWAIDDSTPAGDAKSHKLFSNMIKRSVANPSFKLNGKYLKGVTVRWSGRVVVTANTDSESLRLLPDLDASIREKICLLRTVPESLGHFVSAPMMEDIVTRELPYFARWLIDSEYPEFTKSKDPRFEILPYHETTLTTSANQASNSSAFCEILEDFLSEFFTRHPEKDSWEGTGLALHKQLLTEPAYETILRPYNSQTIGRLLGGLVGKGIFDIADGDAEFSRSFKISRGKRFTKRLNGAIVKQAENSIFQKT